MQLNKGFKVIYGNGIIRELEGIIQNGLIVTMKEIWPVAKDKFNRNVKQVHFVETLEIGELEAFVKDLNGIESVVGIGGGSVADVAKFVSWKKGIPLYQVPSIISVNACVTHMVAIRNKGVVQYVGNAVPEGIYVDYSFIQKAPPRLNRAGLGDILSCHTGLFDWDVASKAGKEPKWNEPLAARTRELLEIVKSNAHEINLVSEKGIQTVMEVHKWVGAMCHKHKHSRFEEGSEHHFAYNLEYVTGKHILHGELVCLGIYIISSLQGNDPEEALRAIKEAGVVIQPKQLGITNEEMKRTLLTLKEYVIAQNLPYTIIHEIDIKEKFIENILRKINTEFKN